MIAIIDNIYNNLKSLSNALDLLNKPYKIIKVQDLSENFSHAIIPGVGHFSKAIEELKKDNGDKKIIEFSKKKKPILGICLGMQLLSSSSEEGGITKGLDLIPGTVNKISINKDQYLPHIGWNSVKILKNHFILEGVKNEMDFYFVHSYCFNLKENSHKVGKRIYGSEFNSIVSKENIVGVQLHPEKSQKYGLKILENFCSWKNNA